MAQRRVGGKSISFRASLFLFRERLAAHGRCYPRNTPSQLLTPIADSSSLRTCREGGRESTPRARFSPHSLRQWQHLCCILAFASHPPWPPAGTGCHPDSVRLERTILEDGDGNKRNGQDVRRLKPSLVEASDLPVPSTLVPSAGVAILTAR